MSEGSEPEFGGNCALGTSLVGDRAPKGSAKHALVKDGKTYYFTSAPAKWVYEHVPALAARAEKQAS